MAEATRKASRAAAGPRGGSRRTARRGKRAEERPASEGAVCPVAFCPIGLALTGIRQVRPETVEHLLAATRELLLAARTVIEARESDVAAAPTPLEHIEIA